MNLPRWLLAILLTAVLAGGCAEHTGHTVSVNPFAGPPVDAEAPPRPKPMRSAPCPYLDTWTVEQAGVHEVDAVWVSLHHPYPACFFYRPDGREQLLVWVYAGDTRTAEGIVTQHAPLGVSDPVSFGAWHGGFHRLDGGSALAINRASSAVVVRSDQDQRRSGMLIARIVINTLRL